MRTLIADNSSKMYNLKTLFCLYPTKIRKFFFSFYTPKEKKNECWWLVSLFIIYSHYTPFKFKQNIINISSHSSKENTFALALLQRIYIRNNFSIFFYYIFICEKQKGKLFAAIIALHQFHICFRLCRTIISTESKREI